MESFANMQPYGEYKEAHLEWLEQVPVEWSIRKLNAFGELNGGGTPHTETSKYWGGDIIWVTPKDLTASKNEYLYSSERTLTELGLPHTSKILSPGTILFGCRAPVGNVAIAGVELTTNQGFISIAPNNKTDTRFLFYLLRSVVKIIQNESSGTTFQEISRSKLSSLKFPLPPLKTQQRIVDFLDAETSRIDNLVSEMEAMITLLQENRKTLISEVVTKGIPGAHTEFKDSGIAWLGEVPVTWKIEKLKKVFTERIETASPEHVHLTPSQKYGTLPQTKYIEISGSRPVLVFSEQAKFKAVHIHDFISHLRSFQGGLEVTKYDGKISPAYTVLAPNTGLVNSSFFSYVFKTPQFIREIASTTDQLRDGQSIKWKQLNGIVLPLPSLKEQFEIAAYLIEQTKKTDILVTTTQEAIELLKEERKVLISDVVTGKVEV